MAPSSCRKHRLRHNRMLPHKPIVFYFFSHSFVLLFPIVLHQLSYLLQFSWTIMSKGKGAKRFLEPMWSTNLWNKARPQHRELRALLLHQVGAQYIYLQFPDNRTTGNASVLSLVGMLVHCRLTFRIEFPVPIYERGTVRFKCLIEEPYLQLIYSILGPAHKPLIVW